MENPIRIKKIQEKPGEKSQERKDTEAELVEDCFTDIMDDDIVNLSSFSIVKREKTIDLDEFSMHRNSIPTAMIGNNVRIERMSRQHTGMISSEAVASQGTARRRIKLEMNPMIHSYAEIPYIGDDDSVENVFWEETAELGKGMKREFLLWKVSCLDMFKAIVYLILMVSILLLVRAMWYFARFTSSIMS